MFTKEYNYGCAKVQKLGADLVMHRLENDPKKIYHTGQHGPVINPQR